MVGVGRAVAAVGRDGRWQRARVEQDVGRGRRVIAVDR